LFAARLASIGMSLNGLLGAFGDLIVARTVAE
jgi:hypothetical protein